MELRARTRHLLRRAVPLAALGAVALVPATAGAATTATAAKKRAKAPTIRSISPAQLSVGGSLTVRGRYFRVGVRKNTVVFKRDRGKAVFVKAGIATKRMLKVKIPSKLQKAMVVVNGQPTATKFRIRILTTRLGRSFSKGKLVPLIGPKVKGSSNPAPKPGAPDGDCDGDKVLNGVDGDDDNDLLDDGVELLYKLDPCKADTDGDEVTDGFEYRSALDLNDDEHQAAVNTNLPYPGKVSYPNPLDSEDAGKDFDGDSLTLAEEYRLWLYTIANGASASLGALTYSDGTQYSIYTRDNGYRHPALPVAGYPKVAEFQGWAQTHGYWKVKLPGESSERFLLDANRNGVVDSLPRADYLHNESSYLDTDEDTWLSDDERDEDADGLSNFVESHGMLWRDWWASQYGRETPFRIDYEGTNLADADTDGDGVRDGADDQDNDDIPNLMELSRNMATGRPFDPPNLSKAATTNADGDPLGSPWYGRVNPFNPCLPDPQSRTCPRYIPFEGAWAPFDGPPYNPDGDDPNYLVRN